MTRELPLTGGALVAVALILVITAGGSFGLVAPARRERSRLAAELGAVSAQIAAATPAPVPISPTERASQRRVESGLKERFPPAEDQLRAAGEAAELARAARLVLTDIEILNRARGATTGGAATTALPFTAPGGLSVNPGVIRLAVRHRYRDLVDFLDRIVMSRTYVAVEALEVRRVDEYLESQIRLASLRWGP